MITLTKRNVKLYFRDRANFFFSLLSIIIIIGLYVLFLGNVWGDETVRALPDANVLRNSWLAAGVLTVATLTTPLGAMVVLMSDRTQKIYKAFYASPVKRAHIKAGYILGAFVVGLVMAFFTAFFWGIYLAAISGGAFPVAVYLRIAGLIFLATISNTAFVYFLASFVRSHGAFETITAIIGTVSGFLMGIYLPIGTLPEAVQRLIILFPPSHATALFRQAFMEIPTQVSFYGAPPQYLAYFEEMMGVRFFFGNIEILPVMNIAVLVVSAAAFYGLSLLNRAK